MDQENSIKKKIYHLLNENKTFINFIYALIILNIVVLVLESYVEYERLYRKEFRAFEIFSIIIFSFEYLGRLYTADLGGQTKKEFAFSFYGIIDLLAILPFFLPFIIKLDLRVLRILRLFRLVRIFKIGRFNDSFTTIKTVFMTTRSDLIMTVFIAFVFLLISSTIMYYVESDVQPDKFQSIPHALWWAISTLTTVGYGDVYPITGVGKLLSSFIAIIGIGFVAFPTGILSSALIEEIKRKGQKCKHCGKSVDDSTSI